MCTKVESSCSLNNNSVLLLVPKKEEHENGLKNLDFRYPLM